MKTQNNTLIPIGTNSAQFWRSRVTGPNGQLRGEKAKTISNLGSEAARSFQAKLASPELNLTQPEDQASGAFLFLKSFLGADAPRGVMATANKLLADIGLMPTETKTKPLTQADFENNLEQAVYSDRRGAVAVEELLSSVPKCVEDLAAITQPILDDILQRFSRHDYPYQILGIVPTDADVAGDQFLRVVEALIKQGGADSSEWVGVFDDSNGRRIRYEQALANDDGKTLERLEEIILAGA